MPEKELRWQRDVLSFKEKIPALEIGAKMQIWGNSARIIFTRERMEIPISRAATAHYSTMITHDTGFRQRPKLADTGIIAERPRARSIVARPKGEDSARNGRQEGAGGLPVR